MRNTALRRKRHKRFKMALPCASSQVARLSVFSALPEAGGENTSPKSRASCERMAPAMPRAEILSKQALHTLTQLHAELAKKIETNRKSSAAL